MISFNGAFFFFFELESSEDAEEVEEESDSESLESEELSESESEESLELEEDELDESPSSTAGSSFIFFSFFFKNFLRSNVKPDNPMNEKKLIANLEFLGWSLGNSPSKA